MANRKIQIDILGDAKNFEGAMGKAHKSTGLLESALKRLGPVGGMVQGVLDKMGLSGIAGAVGITAIGGAVVAFAEKAVEKYLQLADAVRNYQRVTGESAEESSRMVEVANVLGVSSDTLATGMFKLSQRIKGVTDEAGMNAPKLEAVGVQVAHNADGTANLEETLRNVAEAYNKAGSGAERDAIVFAAFGRSGRDLIPILEQGRAGLEGMAAAAQKVFTQEELERAHQYEVDQRRLQRSWEDLLTVVGQQAVPAFDAVLESYNQHIEVFRILKAEYDSGTISTTDFYRALVDDSSEAFKKANALAKANLELTTATDTAAAAQRNAAAAADAEAKAEDTLYTAIHKTIDSGFALEQGELDLATAKKAAADAGGKDAEANLRLREAFVRVADAAVQVAVDQAQAGNETLTASQKAQIFVAKLQELAGSLDVNSPLRKQLQAYIDQLAKVPRAINTQLSLSGASSRAGGGLQSFDSGGTVPGPIGSPQPILAHGGEEVLTPQQQRAGMSAGGGVTNHITVNVDVARLGLSMDGPSVDRLANQIAQRMSYATGR